MIFQRSRLNEYKYKMKTLRTFRIVISLTLTVLLFFIFADYYRLIPQHLSSKLTYFQLIPSLLSFINYVSPEGTGFILIIILTLAAGRIYCSFICPLGFSQDFFIRLGNIFLKKKNSGYSKSHYIIFYSILFISVLTFFTSGTVIILWLDPFSIFGRFITYTASYPLIEVNNGLASFLIKKNVFSVHSLNIRPSIAGLAFSLSFFSLIMVLSFFRGRLYCNLICPAGAMLSIISKFSLFKIRINHENCIQCGKCERVCKSGCIDYNKSFVDTARCVACFNCISLCPNQSISMTLPAFFKKDKNRVPPDKNKGSAVISRLNFLAGLLLVPRILSPKDNNENVLYYQDPGKQKQYKRISYSSPPGSVSIELFNRRCTACSLCISACPTSVLQPAVLQYGLHGIMQPYMDFNTGFCNYDCTLCSDICPTDAIKKQTLAAKRMIQTGKSVFIIENCVTYTNGTDCGACSEHCPTKAVHMVPFKKSLVIPEVNTEICTGCGACEFACPVRPLKAIYVEGNEKHLTAKLPEVIEKTPVKDSEFPF